MVPSVPFNVGDTTCAACGIEGAFRRFAAREMMFGWRHDFTYVECPRCGTLQIDVPPSNLADYYPSDYYSLMAPAVDIAGPNPVRRVAGRWLLSSRSRLASRIVRGTFLHWMKLGAVRLSSWVLDIGCGNGELLCRMRLWGFEHLVGIDPHMAGERDLEGLSLRRLELREVASHFDLIMLHHVLEHLPSPVDTLKEVRERLRPGGRVLIRLPLAGSVPAREYGADWFHLDAPRHLVVPSLAGMRNLAHRAGLSIVHTEFDSSALSFRMSEAYRGGVALKEITADPPAEQVRAWQVRAEALNQSGDADWGLFVLEAAQCCRT